MVTVQQKELLSFIETYSHRLGQAPSLEEIQKHLGLSSVSNVHYHVNRLLADGHLYKIDGKHRSLTVAYPSKYTHANKAAPKQELPLNQIILGDAITELRKLPSESCDIIIVDPPYNIGKDFGNNIDKRGIQEYVAWSKLWIDECSRILKPTGTIFIYGFSEILAHLSVEVSLPKRWLIWHYTNKNVASLQFWQRSHESIICAWKGAPIFNRDTVREPYTDGFLKGSAGKVRTGTAGRFSKGGKETVYQAHEAGALPRDVIKIPALAGGAGMSERWFICRTCHGVYPPRELKKHRDHNTEKHPTQKPLELTRKLILSSAPEGRATVLIPFTGTGSECVVAKSLGHNYISFELNPDYIQLAQTWLANTEVGSDTISSGHQLDSSQSETLF